MSTPIVSRHSTPEPIYGGVVYCGYGGVSSGPSERVLGLRVTCKAVFASTSEPATFGPYN